MVEEHGKDQGERPTRTSDADTPAAVREQPAEGALRTASRTGVLVVFALAVGGAAGWFAKHAHASTLHTSPRAGSASSCEAWEQQVCGGAGEEALACYEARAAANLLPPAACDVALEAVPETLERAAAGREVCNTVIDRLCADLGADTATCAVVQERTQLFPAERCQEMLDNYDQVVDELRMFQQQMSPGAQPSPGEAQPGGPAEEPTESAP
jgi:hypothetical protein